MAHIEAELNLNKTPQIVKNNSLIFAKNIKFGKDKSIMRDDKIVSLNENNIIPTTNPKIVEEYQDILIKIQSITDNINEINNRKKLIDYLIKNNKLNYENIINYKNIDKPELVIEDFYDIANEINDDLNYFMYNPLSDDKEDQAWRITKKEYNGETETTPCREIESEGYYSRNNNTDCLWGGVEDLLGEDKCNSYYKLKNNLGYSITEENDIKIYSTSLPILSIEDWDKVFSLIPINILSKSNYYNRWLKIKNVYEVFYNDCCNNKYTDIQIISYSKLIHYFKGYKDQYDGDFPYAYYINYAEINFILNFIKYYVPIIEDFIKSSDEDNQLYQYLKNQLELLYQDKAKYDKIIEDFDTYKEYDNFKIVGIIPYNSEFFIFATSNKLDRIFKYNEENKQLNVIKCNWTYNNGVIDGVVTTYLNSDLLLTIIEYNADKLVPIKTININRSSFEDDESIYTQAPRIPIVNLNLTGYYINTIPNGTYQFFIRYEIKKDLYTNWIPCSRELQIANIHSVDALQGSAKYVDLKEDSSTSFVFNVEHLIDKTTFNFKRFQIGFILAHDDEVVARSWKKFDINTSIIYFDYDKEYIEEVNIDEILEAPNQIYDVKNITNFKNKTYISNYVETNLNDDLEEYAKNISIIINKQKIAQDKEKYYIYNEEITIRTYNSISYIADNILKYIINDPYSHIRKPGYHPIDNIKVYPTAILRENTIYLNHASNNAVYKIFSDNQAAQDEINKYNYITLDGKLFYRNVRITACDINGDIPVMNIVTNGVYLRTADEFKKFVAEEINKHILGFNYNTGMPIITTRLGGYDCYFKITYNGEQLTKSIQPDSNGNYTVYKYWDESTIKYILKLDTSNIRKVDNTNYTLFDNDIPSLVPLQSYSFYVHYVTETGESTNGYHVTDITIENSNDKTYIFYPTFFNIIIPKNYVACFFSISKLKNKLIYLHHAGNGLFHCLEIDTLTTPLKENFDITLDTDKGIQTGKANYISSGEYNNSKYNADGTNYYLNLFGSSGYVKIKTQLTYQKINNAYIIIPIDYNEDRTKLVKCTPYINSQSYNDYKNLNLLGYNYYGYKLYAHDGSGTDTKYYISGNDIYSGTINNLTEISSSLNISKTNKIQDYSNYNLSILALTDNFKNAFIKIDKTHQIYQVIDSIILSDMYTFPSMYKDYNRPYYFKKDEDSITTYNNTIKSSKINLDEGINYVIKFEALSYYNVPTNKGTITNLKAIGDKILVHTEDSLFSFSGSTKLSGTNSQQVALEESDPFDTGIVELFGSERGFFGLSLKSDSILTQAGYVFYDRSVNIIYLYTGQGYERISDPINKILNYKKINNIIFASDLYNDRIIIHIDFDSVDNEFITLSYNFNTKTYASLHDYKFHNSFSTKTTCYFYKLNEYIKDGIFKYVRDYSGYPHKDLIAKDLYPTININDNPAAIIDVIFNDSYERVKTLNSISWIGKEFNKIITEGPTDFNFINVAEENIFNKQCVKHITIYSNSCLTNTIATDGNGYDYNLFKDKDEIDIRRKDRDNKGLNYPSELSISENAYKLPVYNNGVWSLNYFRNTLNKDKITSEQSLVYGNYIVVRFILDNNFKIENIIFNVQ